MSRGDSLLLPGIHGSNPRMRLARLGSASTYQAPRVKAGSIPALLSNA